MAGWEAALGGSLGGQFRIRVYADVVAQEVGNNRSLIRYNAHVDRVAGGSRVWNGYRTYGNTNINGHNPQRSLGGYDSSGAGRIFTMAQNEDYWIGHDGAGNANPYFGANYDAGNGPYLTSGATGGNFWLPTIPRYANITGWNLNTVTEKSIRVSVSTDRTANAIDYSINGSGWIRGYNGNFTSAAFVIGNLNPATDYSIRIRVHNPDSGLWTETGVAGARTNAVTITALTSPSTTDTTVEVLATVSHVADQLQWRAQGTSTWLTSATADFTSKQVTVTDLAADALYTIEVRARHKDSQQWTPIKTVQASTGYPQPLQPSNLSPANGLGIGTRTPTLSWQYNATSPDAQSAYQIIIRREDTGATVYDSGKVVGGTPNAVVPQASQLAWNVNYQWQVRTWSATDIQGAYSNLALFKTSQAPVIVVTEPTAGESIQTDAPIIEWTYTDPEGTAQRGWSLTITEIDAPGDTTGPIVYQTEQQTSAAKLHAVPTAILQNNQRYLVVVKATDGDGIVGTSAGREFEVDYVGPSAPNIDVQLSEDLLFAQISASSNVPENDAFDTTAIRLYRRKVGAATWDSLGEVQTNHYPLEDFENTSGWFLTGKATSMELNDNHKSGSKSISLVRDAGSLAPGAVDGWASYDRDINLGSLTNYEKMRYWVYARDTALFYDVTFKIGKDYQNYYTWKVFASDLEEGAWNSFEINIGDLEIVGNPNQAEIFWESVSTGGQPALAEGDLLIDGWNLVPFADDVFAYDYDLENGASYEYAASAFNQEEGLESEKTIVGSPVNIKYADMRNTYLIPKGAETQGLVAFMDASSTPNWKTEVETAYFKPKGSRKPVAYSMDDQQFRTGSVELRFFDDLFGGDGLNGIHDLERIMNHKPLTIRTWWGENLQISIDGQVSTERLRGIGWIASFSFTEIEG